MKNLLHKSKLYLKRASPTILTCMGVVGVIATAVTAARATPKAIKLLEKATNEKGEELTKSEAVQVAWRCYIPTALLGASTILCIVGINALNKRNQASLASAYAILNQSYRRYRQAAKAVYGEDADIKIRAEAAKETYISAGGYYTYSSDLDKNGDKILFFDDYSGRYFTSTIASVINAQYHLNRNLVLRGESCVNEFYKFLGLDSVDGGDDVGWSYDAFLEDNFMWLDFDNSRVKLEDGMECYILSAQLSPAVLDS